MLKLITSALALMTVASCATMTSHEAAVDSLRGSRSCCVSLAQLGYDQLGESGSIKFNLDASSKAYDFPSGKSYFKAFRLPGKALPYRIRISSFALGEHIDKAHVFYPQIALLDNHFSILRQSTSGDFSLKKAAVGETWGLPVKLEGYAVISDPNAKYLVLYTTQEQMRGSTPYETLRAAPVILPGLVTAIPTHKEEIRIPHSPFGLLQLEVTGTTGPG